MKKWFRYSYALCISIFFSCSDSFFEIKPKGQASIDDLSSKTGVEALLLGAYAAVDGVNGKLGDGWASAESNWVWGEVASDNAYKGSVSGDQNPINAIEGFFVEATNVYVTDHWTTLFDGVQRANVILQVLPRVQDIAETERRQIEAQARFLRAHFYVELVRVHGNVPYIDENTENPGEVPNDRPIWNEIEADLQFASDHLPHRWTDKGRATKWAAITYKAYIHMLQNEHAEARPLLLDVYENGGFSLMPSYEQNYRTAYVNNEESIFEVQYAVNDGFQLGQYTGSPNAGPGNSIIGMTFMGGSGFLQPSHNLVSAFRVGDNGLPLLDDTYTPDDILPYSTTGASVLYTEPVDPRLDHTVGRPGVPFLDWGVQLGHAWIRDPTNGGPYITKKQMFLLAERGSNSGATGRTFSNANNYRKFKLSHVILWLAECEAEIGSLARATELTNLLRNRAKQSNVVSFDDGTPAANYKVEPYPVAFPTKEYARKAIRHEHRMELAMEGYRFYDLVRWGVAGPVLNNFMQVESTRMSYYQGRHFTVGQNEIWPVPQREIDLSVKDGVPVLVQNPGY
ncbi:Starch-binding associating with outer membrane [Parapedobacter luteus]|uniref:Starch-binding associating with outer membrane n=1 Tax=Parapedobacter luteus TaxID=623280 RepID=A0A1T5AG88_9SPHI|nr:RagB/SusD family nutrient uptake outer membrane protein [Parapedobacter luteus]SKB33946.1 Starch-binding associating with outer membrane [Parapedobacter luteus]